MIGACKYHYTPPHPTSAPKCHQCHLLEVGGGRLLLPFIYADKVLNMLVMPPLYIRYYFPKMTRDEAMLILQWDSLGSMCSGTGGSKATGATAATATTAAATAAAAAATAATPTTTTAATAVDTGTTGRSGNQATFALHSAFIDPSSAADAPDRESIEVRLVLIF